MTNESQLLLLRRSNCHLQCNQLVAAATCHQGHACSPTGTSMRTAILWCHHSMPVKQTLTGTLSISNLKQGTFDSCSGERLARGSSCSLIRNLQSWGCLLNVSTIKRKETTEYTQA
jgi:hypothetical protein